MIDGNDAQIRKIIEQVVKQANELAREGAAVDRERGLGAQLTLTEKIVGACLIALLLWVGATVQLTATKVAVIESQMRGLSEGRYTASDAAKDHQVISGRTEALERRVDVLEKR